MSEITLNNFSNRLDQIKLELQEELSGIRSNRAHPTLVEGIEVEAYGSKMKIRDLAHISAPEPRLLLIQPWDASQVESIAKSLGSAGIGITPSVDGGLIRLPLPPLTEERRSELVKLVRSKLEHSKVSARQARHEALGGLEGAKKSSTISEDELERLRGLIQKELDRVSAELEAMALSKESEVMTV